MKGGKPLLFTSFAMMFTYYFSRSITFGSELVSIYPKGTCLSFREFTENFGASFVTFTEKEKGTKPNSFTSFPLI